MQIEKIISEYGDYLLRVAYLYVENSATAEDIVQDVFVAFYEKQDQFRGEASLKTYLVKMTVNRSHDYLRSWKSRRTTLYKKVISKGKSQSPERAMLEKSEKMELVEALFTLTIPYREVLILYYYEEMSTVQIAKLVNCPESTVRTRLQRARKQLGNRITDYEWGEYRYE